ncbi:MAG: alpha/beta hydrolase [Opitutaceae bacterium]
MITQSFAAGTVEQNIAYLGAERAEKLDVYLPAADFARPLPAVLLVHGGGWAVGDKASGRERSIGETLSSHGYVVFSINYLLNTSEKDSDGKPRLTRLAWPQSIIDCKTALRFIRAEHARFGVDPALIGVMGGSAGGHLSMLVGAAPEHAAFNTTGLYTDQRNGVSCIIDLYGPADIRGRGVSPFANATKEMGVTPALETEASPVTYFDAKTPPMLIVHGTADKVIPVERSRELTRILEKIGVDYWYVEIAGAPHTFDLQPPQMDVRTVLLSFLAKHLGTPVTSAR